MLIQVGNTPLYSSPTVASVFDPLATLSEIDTLTLAEMFPPTNLLWMNSPGVSIEHYVDGRSTANFAVLDSASTLDFRERQLVLITDADGARYYAGLVQSADVVPVPHTAYRIQSISSADFTSMLDGRVIDYAAESKLAGTAVEEIIAEYLAEEGITVGVIEAGELLDEIALSNVSALTGLQKLADACGFVLYLDYELKLYFHARTTYAADWSLTDAADILTDSLSFSYKNPNYRNTEIVTGGYEETAVQTETFSTDGVAKSFPLGYPVNRVTSVTVNGSVQTVGVKGYDSGGGYACYYANKSETLTFEAAPAAGTGTIVYYGLWKAKSKAEDLTVIALNKTRQGVGSGKIEHITADESLTSLIAAGEYANATIANYGVDGITCQYRTRRAGLSAGTLQHIEIGDVHADFLITNVSEDHRDGDTEYSVTACYGPVDETWDLFFREQAKQSSVSEGVDAGGVSKLYNFSHTYATADRPNPFTTAAIGAGLAVSSDTWPNFAHLDRAEYVEFWDDGACVFRKAHTSVPDETNMTSFYSYSFISPAEAVGTIDEVVFWGGDSSTATYGTGVEMYRANFAKTKTSLESLQINMNYIKGA